MKRQIGQTVIVCAVMIFSFMGNQATAGPGCFGDGFGSCETII